MRKQTCTSLLTPHGDVTSHGFLINWLRLPGFLAAQKGSQQDDIRPNHPDNVGNHPVLRKRAHHPARSPKSSCCVATKSEPISDHSNKEEVGGCLPALERQDGSRQKHQGVGPKITFSP